MPGHSEHERGRTADLHPLDRVPRVPPVTDSEAHRHLPVAACGIDDDGLVRSWNPAAERLLGWTADEVLGREPPFLGEGASLVSDTPPGPGLLAAPTLPGGGDGTAVGGGNGSGHAEDPSTIELQVMDLRGDEAGTTHEIRTRRRDGSTCWLSLSTVAGGSPDALGQPSGTWCFLVDTTATHESRSLLASNEATWQILFRNLSDAVTVTDADGRIRRSSGEVNKVLGYEPDSWVGAQALSFLHPDELPVARKLFDQILTHPGTPFRQVFRTRRADGRWDDIEYTVINHLEDPLVEGLIIITRNVTAVRGAELLLAAQAEVLELIATDATLTETMDRIADLVAEQTGSQAAVLRIDSQPTRVAGASSSVDQLTADAFGALSLSWLTAGAHRGGGPARVSHDLLAELPFAPATRRAVHHFVEGGAQMLRVLTVADTDSRPHSALVWLCTHGTQLGHDDAVAEVAGHLIEIAVDRARSRASLEHAVRHHLLTRLPNRVLVNQRIEEVLAESEATGGHAAVLCIDIDRFKVVNDSLGHGAGDRLLARVAGRLRSLVTGDDLIGHFAADEFVAVLAPPTSLVAALDLAADVERVLAEPFALPEGEVYLSASIGIATTASRPATAAELFQSADAALARAKKLGRSRVEVFDGVLRDEALNQLHLERDLRLALDRNELAVHYQLEWDVTTGAPVGAEALLRWNHPERGLVHPSEFIRLAEETGLIRRIGRWVLDEAVRSARRWVDTVDGLDDFIIGVNVSARQLTSSDLSRSVERVLEAYDWSADRLALELTESVLVDELDAAFEVMHELKELGVLLALDDFGTGFSSLNYLHRFPVDLVKVDQSFVAGLRPDGSGSPVASAVLQVAQTLGLVTIAEGVETSEQLEALQNLGCTWAQGFLLARPCPADEVARLLAEARNR